MSFKDTVAADNSIFLNANEFAELRTIKYDGNVYESIPVILTKVKESERTVVTNNYTQGIHLVSVVAHMSVADIGGVLPEQKRHIMIDDGEALGLPFFQKFTIVTSHLKMGLVTLELEAYDE